MIDWTCVHTWKRSSINTLWCLLGCAIGDFATIFYFQNIEHSLEVWQVMAWAMFNGLLTSIFLETAILIKQHFRLIDALRVALGMSFISMLAMETAMNITDYLLTGGAVLTWWAIPLMLLAGFITPLPYNYWRLKAHGVSCH